MREYKRIKRIVNKLEQLWKKYPDQRLGQLLENYAFVKGERGDKTSRALFFQEDEETEQILDILLNGERQ